MPAHNCCGLDDREGAPPVPPNVGEQDPEESVARAQLWASDRELQGSELLTKREIRKGSGPLSGADQADCRRKTTTAISMVNPVADATSDSTDWAGRSRCGEDRKPALDAGQYVMSDGRLTGGN